MASTKRGCSAVPPTKAYHRPRTPFLPRDVWIQILSLLPCKSLCQFKSVSKHWRSLISDLTFPPTSLSPYALFLHVGSWDGPDIKFVPLNNENHRTSASYENPSNFIPQPFGVEILSSCNGLLCCYSLRLRSRNCYLYNPTTKQFRKLPKPGRGGVSKPIICGMNLAFHPSQSPRYKIICVRRLEESLEPRPRDTKIGCGFYRLEIYSSDLCDWGLSGEPFEASLSTCFKRGVYWNGSIHWTSSGGGDSLYFNVERELIQEMKMPPVPGGWFNCRKVSYFGESQGHLNLIEIYNHKSAQFHVYEMEIDYSEWFVKYQVDLNFIPIVIEKINLGYSFVPLLVVRGDIDEESFLVLYVHGKVIRYNFEGKTFKKLCDFGQGTPYYHGTALGYGGWLNAFPFIQSFSRV